jgi:glycosyltransferase involved in cell wall biosynthesis
MDGSDNLMFSIIIPVRDRWNELLTCVHSIAGQYQPPAFEIVIVDDGSNQEVPQQIQNLTSILNIRFIRQIPLGISLARNRGIAEAKGAILFFVDSDSILDEMCLRNLNQAITDYPDDIAFQPCVVGTKSTTVGRMEDLRLTCTQRVLSLEDGHIRFANTTAFALKGNYLKRTNVFDPRATRGEDSLLLDELVGLGKLPRYVISAVVQHNPRLPLQRYIRKHFWIGYYSGYARQELEKTGRIRMSSSERRKTLKLIWQISHNRSSKLTAVLIIVATVFERIGRVAWQIVGAK